jgi:hypothetical protein
MELTEVVMEDVVLKGGGDAIGPPCTAKRRSPTSPPPKARRTSLGVHRNGLVDARRLGNMDGTLFMQVPVVMDSVAACFGGPTSNFAAIAFLSLLSFRYPISPLPCVNRDVYRLRIPSSFVGQT